MTDKIIQVPVKDLIPYVNNAKKHSDEQITQIAASIMEFGFINPILVDKDNVLIAGHGRLAGAKKIGMEEVPCLYVDHLTDTQKKAYILADNRLAELGGGWDSDLLSLELKSLLDEDFNIELTGFDGSFADLEEEGLTDEDEVPEPPVNPVTVRGDVWILGEHRVLCGDATVIDDVDKLMSGKKADLVFTDPPYNTGMTEKENKKTKNGSTSWLSHMFNDSFTDDEWQKFMADFCVSYDIATKDNSFIYVCLDWRRSYELIPHLKKHWKFSNLIVWDKQVHGLGSDYKYTHEFIHVCKKGKPPLAANKEGEKEYQDVWRIQRKMGRDEEHATKKPIELCERAIRHGSEYKNLVLDLFGGSGSTLIAAEKNNRVCYMAELSEQYVDVIVNRWEKFTGKKAIHENGKTFEQLSKDRLK